MISIFGRPRLPPPAPSPHPTLPAPPLQPSGLILGSDKRYGGLLPLVVGRAVVEGQVVFADTPVAGTGSTRTAGAWITAMVTGIKAVIALCEAPVTSVTRCYRHFSGTEIIAILTADFTNRLVQAGGSLTVITAATATAWSEYVGTSSEGLAHSGTCHVRAKGLILDDGSTPATRWEVQGTIGCVRPVLSSATPSSTGGTLASGTYYYKVAAILPSGETPTLNELSAVVAGPTGSVALVWTAVPGATGYKVFGRTGPDTENQYWLPGAVTTYTDTGTAGTAGTTISTPDAEAADFLVWLLTDATHGLGFSASLVDVDTGADGAAASSYRRYTRARGWYLSRVIESGSSIAGVIDELLLATNSTLVEVDGKLKAIPLDDEASSTGSTWPGHASYPYTPASGSTAIGDADYAEEGDPVEIERTPASRVRGIYPVDYTLRKDDAGDISYAVNHAEWQYDVFTSANGIRRAEAIDLTPWILSEQHAWFVSYLVAQREQYHRTGYSFALKPAKGIALAPGDLVTISDSISGLSGVGARALSAEEDEDGRIQIEALEWPQGTTQGFALGTTAPVGRTAVGASDLRARANLSNVPAGAGTSALIQPISDRDNLWPNPSSELAPPDGADATQPEWANRVDTGTPPPSPSATAVGSGGTFAAGTYYWKISSLGSWGESSPSSEVSATLVLNGSCNLTWGAVAGATGYRVYRGTTAGGENVYYLPGAVTAYTDTNAASTAGSPTVGAYSGSWVRQVTAAVSGFWVPCSPGAMFYAEAQAKRTSGTGSGGRLNVGFYPTLGSFTGGLGLTSGAYSTLGSWAKVTVTSAAAPAGANAAYVSFEAATGDTVQFDALYARRVLQPEAVGSEVITLSASSGWVLGTGLVRKVGGLVVGVISATAQSTGSPSWNSIATLPVGARPLAITPFIGEVVDNSTGTVYLARFTISTTGVVLVDRYDDGTSLLSGSNPGMFTIGSGDSAYFSFAFPWQ